MTPARISHRQKEKSALRRTFAHASGRKSGGKKEKLRRLPGLRRRSPDEEAGSRHSASAALAKLTIRRMPESRQLSVDFVYYTCDLAASAASRCNSRWSAGFSPTELRPPVTPPQVLQPATLLAHPPLKRHPNLVRFAHSLEPVDRAHSHRCDLQNLVRFANSSFPSASRRSLLRAEPAPHSQQRGPIRRSPSKSNLIQLKNSLPTFQIR